MTFLLEPQSVTTCKQSFQKWKACSERKNLKLCIFGESLMS